jgi:hypothetical protein
MFEDRRKHPRVPVLHKAQLVSGRERLDVVCTNVSASGAFVQSRSLPPLGGRVTLATRAGGPHTPLVELTATAVRTVPAGGMWPAGFAVTWQLARCALGSEPLERFLREVLHLTGLSAAALQHSDRMASLDVAQWCAAASPPVQSAGQPTSPKPVQVRRPDPELHDEELPVAGLDDAEAAASMLGAHSPSSRHGLGPQAIDDVAASVPHLGAPRSRQAASADNVLPWLREATGVRPHLGQVSARLQGQGEISSLRSGGPITHEITDIRPLRITPAPTQTSPWLERSKSGVSSPGPHPSGLNTPVSGLQTTVPGSHTTVSGLHERPLGKRMLHTIDVPVSFLRQHQFVPGRAVAISAQAVAVVTHDEPPLLDEALVVHLPVAVDGIFKTVYLNGRLLQVAQDTPAGRRFVMHIERVEEGTAKGAFRGFLEHTGA